MKVEIFSILTDVRSQILTSDVENVSNNLLLNIKTNGENSRIE